MKITIKKIKYENKTNSIKALYPDFYLYFAQKTKKNTLFNVRKMLDPFRILLLPCHKEWCLLSPLKDQIPWNLYTLSSSIYIGFPMSDKPMTIGERWKVRAQPTKPLMLITTCHSGQIYDPNRYRALLKEDPLYFFSPYWIDEITRPKDWNPNIPHHAFLDFYS